MKGFWLGIVLIILVGIGGLIYRNILERPVVPAGACTLEAKVCPDGEAVGRVAPSCDFAPCPFPNVTLSQANIIFALPAGYASTTLPDASSIAAYFGGAGTTSPEIVIHEYAVASSSESVIYATALSDASGNPVSPSTFSAVTLGNHTFSFVVLGRFEGVVHTAYYLPVGQEMLRFDAISQGVADWTDPNLDPTTLTADTALRAMLTTLQTNQ